MISRYGIFCRAVELHSFTRAADELGYSQSAVSQTIKNLEGELGVTLVDRRKGGLLLTADGEQFYPYISAVYAAERALSRKREEVAGLENSVITIGTFTSVSRTILPPLMKAFKQRHPSVTFVLRQGDYNSLGKWVSEDSVDFAFMNEDAISSFDGAMLYDDEMVAVLPQDHPLALCSEVSLCELAREPLILLDEGGYSVPTVAFEARGLTPDIAYEVYDDYTILAMVQQGLGVSILYQRVLEDLPNELVIRPIKERLRRTVSLIWRDRSVLSKSASQFADFIISHRGTM